jgi:glycosyltransferase involved in cell wall biosynthesis
MKVAFVLNSLQGGGIGKVVSTYANELAKDRNINLYLILLHKEKHLFKINDYITIIENPNFRNKLGKAAYTYLTFWFLRKIFKLNNFDRIISNGEWINSFVFLAGIGLERKLYFADHSNPIRPGQSPFALLDNFTYKRVNGVLVLSDQAAKRITEKIKQRNVIRLINPVQLLNKKEVQQENIIITIGRLSKEKGQDLLLKAFARLNCTDWRLQILGDGHLRKDLEALAKELLISSRVDFLGHQSDLELHLSKAKIFVLPSLTENFPMALIEAMSIGLPCVVTDCTSWRATDDFINNGINGIKVPVNNIPALAEGIACLIDSNELRTKYSAESLKVRENFSMEKIINEFRKAIDI